MQYGPLIGILLSALPLAPLAGQQAMPIQPGARVRVTALHLDLVRHVGTLARVDADTLVVDATPVPIQWISELDVSRGRKSHWLAGMGIGFLAGAGVGALVGATACTGGDLYIPEACALIGAGLFGAIGIPVGTLIGAAVRTDRWEAIPLDRIRVRAFRRGDGRLSLAVSLSL
jgi:hypothetical protein